MVFSKDPNQDSIFPSHLTLVPKGIVSSSLPITMVIAEINFKLDPFFSVSFSKVTLEMASNNFSKSS